MIWLSVLCIMLFILVIALSIKIILLRKSVAEIREEFAEKLKSDTNTLITISTQDNEIKRLANEINGQLRELRRERHRFQQGDLELKNAVTNISHDLRTPLTAISGYLDLLDDVEKNETTARYIELLCGFTGTKNNTEYFNDGK